MKNDKKGHHLPHRCAMNILISSHKIKMEGLSAIAR